MGVSFCAAVGGCISITGNRHARGRVQGISRQRNCKATIQVWIDTVELASAAQTAALTRVCIPESQQHSSPSTLFLLLPPLQSIIRWLSAAGNQRLTLGPPHSNVGPKSEVRTFAAKNGPAPKWVYIRLNRKASA